MEVEKEEIKIIFLHPPGVGATNIISILNGQSFNPSESSTFNCSFVNYDITFNNQKYALHLWDTPGQEKYISITKLFIKGSNIVIFVYDITQRISLKELI